MTTASERRKGQHRINPSNYFDAGEVSILRAYFGLKLRKVDPPLDSLYAEDEEAGPIRLSKEVQDDDQITALSNAVARICLADAQDRLPQWAAIDAKGNQLLGRHEFGHEPKLLPLQPHRLLCINWADSGPGFSWPEDYYVTFLPGFDRHVVTASADSPDCYGVTDFAIGHFRDAEEFAPACRRIVKQWWRECGKDGGEAWEYLFDEGLIDEETAEEMRQAVWGGGCDST